MPCGLGLTCEFNTGPIMESNMHRNEFQMEIDTQHAIPFEITLLGWMLAKFTQLKRNKRFDRGPRITISYCCRVTSCTGSLGVTR